MCVLLKAMGGIRMVEQKNDEDLYDEDELYDDDVYDDVLSEDNGYNDEFEDENEYTDLDTERESRESPADSLFPEVIIGFMSMIMGEDSRQ